MKPRLQHEIAREKNEWMEILEEMVSGKRHISLQKALDAVNAISRCASEGRYVPRHDWVYFALVLFRKLVDAVTKHELREALMVHQIEEWDIEPEDLCVLEQTDEDEQ